MSWWIKGLIALAVVAFISTGVLSYNHAIAKAKKLEHEGELLKGRITQLESDAMTHATRMKDISDLLADHTQAISSNNQKATKRLSYIEQQYRGASDEKRAFLDTPMPEYRCVFEGSCETPVLGVPAKTQ